MGSWINKCAMCRESCSSIPYSVIGKKKELPRWGRTTVNSKPQLCILQTPLRQWELRCRSARDGCVHPAKSAREGKTDNKPWRCSSRCSRISTWTLCVLLESWGARPVKKTKAPTSSPASSFVRESTAILMTSQRLSTSTSHPRKMGAAADRASWIVNGLLRVWDHQPWQDRKLTVGHRAIVFHQYQLLALY